MRTLTAMIALVLSVAATASSANKWSFEVSLDDRVVGSHEFLVTNNGGVTIVQSDAQFDVKVLFFTAFRYQHNSEEQWVDNCVARIDATTSSNGKIVDIEGRRIDNALQLNSAEADEPLVGCIQTFAYWNPSILDAKYLLNPQTGEYVEIDVAPLGQERVYYAGKNVDARSFLISNQDSDENKRINIKLWYSADTMQWLGLRSLVKGGRVLEYKALSGPEVSAFYAGSKTPVPEASTTTTVRF